MFSFLKNGMPTMLAALLLVSGCSETYTEEELLTAAEEGNLKFVSTILHSGQSANVRDECYFTPLMKAAQQGHVEIVRELLDKGGMVDLYDKGGYTALMLAAGSNRVEVVRLLLEYGADVNRQEETNGWTALIWAAKSGYGEVVQLLLAYGADTALSDHKGLTAIDWSRQQRHEVVIRLLTEAPAG